jgi:hypothetical protein
MALTKADLIAIGDMLDTKLAPLASRIDAAAEGVRVVGRRVHLLDECLAVLEHLLGIDPPEKEPSHRQGRLVRIQLGPIERADAS